MPLDRHFMENSMSSVRQSQPHPNFLTISADMHIPVPPKHDDRPKLYFPKCHKWFTVQKAMAKVPDIHVSVGFLADK